MRVGIGSSRTSTSRNATSGSILIMRRARNEEGQPRDGYQPQRAAEKVTFQIHDNGKRIN
jgi:hypothetical protein